MKLIKVDATTSTNHLAKVLNEIDKKDNFCVSANFQTEGRGQLKSSWQSKKSKNLMFTVVLNQIRVNVNHQFLINALVCLKIFKVLEKYNLPNLSLKWPNDILSDNFKICGVLIENIIKGNILKTIFIGIGLNVNQTEFIGLPHASSLKKILGHSVNKDQLLNEIINELSTVPSDINFKKSNDIIRLYKNQLYKFNVKSKFLLPGDQEKLATIKDIHADGELLVEFDSGVKQCFRHKEIKQVL